MDTLRPPPPLDPRPEAYRDWLHFNIFEPTSGVVGLVNLSLHGDPADPRARAIGTALVHHPELGWLGDVEVRDLRYAHLTESSIGLSQVAIASDPRHNQVHVSVRMDDAALAMDCRAYATSATLRVEQQLPFGSGWISWSVLPRMRVEGSVTLAGKSLSLAAASGYHDHNWGRFRWGDDIGWDWGTFSDRDSATTIVFSRATDRDRRTVSPFLVSVEGVSGRLSFTGAGVRYAWQGAFRDPLRRLPGSLAALHTDRQQPALPSVVRLEASDGRSRLWVEFTVRAAAQLIAAEPTRPGTSFVHEMVGAFRGELLVGNQLRPLAGVGVVEYVD